MTKLVRIGPVATAGQGASRALRRSFGAFPLTPSPPALNSGKFGINYETVSFRRKVLEPVLRITSTPLRGCPTLTHSVDAAVPSYIVGDPLRLVQVLTNLITNAQKVRRERVSGIGRADPSTPTRSSRPRAAVSRWR